MDTTSKDKRLVGDIASYLHRTFAADEQMYSQIKENRKVYYRGIAKNLIVKVRLNTK
jgi:hypothetical protein